MSNALHRVAIIGSGNWGSGISKLIGLNTQAHPELFEAEVRMWVFEELVDGRPLSQIINQDHENVKYLPGIKLPENVVAVPDVVAAVRDATVLVFVIPHQFVHNICQQLKGKLHPDAIAVSLIKGVDVSHAGLSLISDLISSSLGLPCSVLMGANIASEVASEMFCESTVGYAKGRQSDGELLKTMFQTRWFRITAIEDVHGVELCGALKNIVAVAAGLVDGLGYGSNTKAAVIRVGLVEMRRFAERFYEGVRADTFFESCGVADVITSCLGGRNRRVAEAFAKTRRPLEELEAEMLNGQKLQGTSTAKEVHQILSAQGLCDEFPLFTRVYRICYEGVEASHIVTDL